MLRLTASAVLLVAVTAAAGAQELGFQPSEGAPVTPLSAEMAERLDDPFFRNVLQLDPAAFQLTIIEQLIQPDAGKRTTFVVSEEIHRPGGPGFVRSVIAFDGDAPNGDPLRGNVFISTPLRPTDPGLPELSDVEVMAWDQTNGTYNYYKLAEGPGHGGRSWRFRGSSERADAMADEERAGTCFACHLNGAPVMKELLLPWNNWHASTNRVAGLVAPLDDLRWAAARRVGGDPRLTTRLGQGEELEGLVTDAIVRLNRVRITRSLGAPDRAGSITVADAPRLLRPLFETTEINLISAHQQSGLNVTGGPEHRTGQPGATVKISNSFFLNANLIASGFKVPGLGVTEAGSFEEVPALSLQPAEYAALVRDSGQRVGDTPGDVEFAWFVPEASFIDNNMVAQLIETGVIAKEFAAAALAIDVERPIFSDARASLLRFVPQSYVFEPGPSTHPDALTRSVIANLEAAAPAEGTPEAEFLALLRDENPLERLRERVLAVRHALSARAADGTERDRLFQELVISADARRRTMATAAAFRSLVESPLLLPLASP